MIKHSFGEEILAAVSRRYSTRSSWEKTVLPVVEELFDKGTSFREVDNARVRGAYFTESPYSEDTGTSRRIYAAFRSLH